MDRQGSKSGIRKRTLVDEAYDYLRKCITDFSLNPGQKINIRLLAEKLSVSQTPIREALRKLAEQGLVEPVPYKGYFVVQLGPEDIQQLFDLRIALETLSLKYMFDKVDERDVDKYLQRLDELEKHGFLVEETRQFDDEFHLEFLIKGSNNKWLERFTNGIADLIKLSTRLSINPQAACKEHREILLALKRRDFEEALAALQKHLERSKREALTTTKKDVSAMIQERH